MRRIISEKKQYATTEIDGNTMKKPRIYSKSMEKLVAFEVLVKGGIEKTKAAEVLGYKSKTAYALQERIEKDGKRLDVASQGMVRLAHRAIKNLLKGQPWGEIETINASAALAAALVVVDRHQPKHQENIPPPLSFTKIIDIEQARLVRTDCGSPDISKETTIEVDPHDPE